jgi:hypothetical protein
MTTRSGFVAWIDLTMGEKSVVAGGIAAVVDNLESSLGRVRARALRNGMRKLRIGGDDGYCLRLRILRHCDFEERNSVGSL